MTTQKQNEDPLPITIHQLIAASTALESRLETTTDISLEFHHRQDLAGIVA